MKRHYRHFDDLSMEECTIGEPRIAGNVISLPILRDLMIFKGHPLGGGTRTFFCDGFTMVFEGVKRSMRELVLYAGDPTKDGFKGTIRVNDGPFPEPDRPTTTFDLGGGTQNPSAYIETWEIDAAEFYLVEPEGSWEKHEYHSALRAERDAGRWP